MRTHSGRVAGLAAKATTGARRTGGKRAGEKIFEVAADLFYRESIRSVGVETIVKAADVSKITLYRNFASKDDLIFAYLESRNVDYWRTLDRVMAKEESPRAGFACFSTTSPAAPPRRAIAAVRSSITPRSFPTRPTPVTGSSPRTKKRCGSGF